MWPAESLAAGSDSAEWHQRLDAAGFAAYPNVVRLPAPGDALLDGLAPTRAEANADGSYLVEVPGLRLEGWSSGARPPDEFDAPSACPACSSGDHETFGFVSPRDDGRVFIARHRPSTPERLAEWVVGWHELATAMDYRLEVFGGRAEALGVDAMSLSANRLAATQLVEQAAAFRPYNFGLPVSVADWFPPDALIKRVVHADLTGTGRDAWALLTVSESNRSGPPLLRILTDDGSGALREADAFRLSEWLTADVSADVEVGDRPTLDVRGLAAGNKLGSMLVRWDEHRFWPVFQGTRTELEDLDGDGTPEVIDRYSTRCAGSGGPDSVRVWRWDGERYAPATGDYAALYESVRADLEDAAQTTQNRTSLGCIYRELARLEALRRGSDSAGAHVNCDLAVQYEARIDAAACLHPSD